MKGREEKEESSQERFYGVQRKKLCQRHAVHKIVSYTHGRKQLLTLTLDLAMGGIKIKTHYRLPENELLNFELVMGDNSICPKGRIVYSKSLSDKQSASCIQFIELSAQDHGLLEEYVFTLEE